MRPGDVVRVVVTERFRVSSRIDSEGLLRPERDVGLLHAMSSSEQRSCERARKRS